MKSTVVVRIANCSQLNVKVVKIRTVGPAEIWLRDDLENIHMLLFRFLGNGFRLALCNVDDAEARHSGARSHRLRAVVGAARLHGKLCENSLKTHLPGLPLRGFLWYTFRNKDDMDDGVPTDQRSHNHCDCSDSHL